MNFQDWLAREQFQPLDVPNTWGRKSRYGAPPSRTTGQKVDLIVEKIGDVFTMGIDAGSVRGEVSLRVAGISELDLIRHGRGIEHRLVAAWIELAN